MTAREVFEKFVPKPAVSYCNQLYERLDFEFKIKKARQTKFGDYRFNPQNEKHTITINNDLNPYAFLITYLHEIAHLLAFKQYGRKIKPHGAEWKACFREVTVPVLHSEVFPKTVLSALKKYFKNPKASSCTDPVLYTLLKQFDVREKGIVLLKEMNVGERFWFQQKSFIKLETKRTRAICEEIKTRRKYAIAEIAEVKVLND